MPRKSGTGSCTPPFATASNHYRSLAARTTRPRITAVRSPASRLRPRARFRTRAARLSPRPVCLGSAAAGSQPQAARCVHHRRAQPSGGRPDSRSPAGCWPRSSWPASAACSSATEAVRSRTGNTPGWSLTVTDALKWSSGVTPDGPPWREFATPGEGEAGSRTGPPGRQFRNPTSPATGRASPYPRSWQ